MKVEIGLYLDHKEEERVLLLFSLVLLSSRDFFILKVNYTIQVYKINLDLENPLVDRLWPVYHWPSAKLLHLQKPIN